MEQRLQENRHQGRLPVVAVDNVRNPVHVVQRGQGSLAEEAVFWNVIYQVDIGVPGREELLVVDEVVHHSIVDVFHNPHIVIPAGSARSM